MSKRYVSAQINALDRVMYLLEEHSFQTLAMDNEAFADFIEQLYAQVNREISSLQHAG